MLVEVLPEAIGLFVVTNVDDLVLLTVFFGRATAPDGIRRVVAGQYLGFGAIVIVSVMAALGARQLPGNLISLLGLVPLTLGLKAGWDVWRHRNESDPDPLPPTTALGSTTVAAITFANGADNIGVYVPVFAVAAAGVVLGTVAVFAVLVGLWCALGLWLARRRPVALALSRWGHVVLPVVLIGIGVAILLEGGVVGL